MEKNDGDVNVSAKELHRKGHTVQKTEQETKTKETQEKQTQTAVKKLKKQTEWKLMESEVKDREKDSGNLMPFYH